MIKAKHWKSDFTFIFGEDERFHIDSTLSKEEVFNKIDFEITEKSILCLNCGHDFNKKVTYRLKKFNHTCEYGKVFGAIQYEDALNRCYVMVYLSRNKF